MAFKILPALLSKSTMKIPPFSSYFCKLQPPESNATSLITPFRFKSLLFCRRTANFGEPILSTPIPGQTLSHRPHATSLFPSRLNLIPSRRFYSDWKDLVGQDKVTFLTDKNIDSFIRNSGGPLLIMFYAPWCAHCRSAKPEFAKAAYILAQEAPNAQLAAIDCIVYPTVYEKFDVVGYPTIKYYWQGREIGEYHHRRRAMDIVHFMLREPKNRNDM